MVLPYVCLESAPWQIKLIHLNLPRHQLVRQRLAQHLPTALVQENTAHHGASRRVPVIALRSSI